MCLTRLSVAGVKFIMGSEGWNNVAYADNDGNVTIGPGFHVNQICGAHIALGQYVDDNSITNYLNQGFQGFYNGIKHDCKWDWNKITQNQWDAMMSAYWSGIGTAQKYLAPHLNNWYNGNITKQELIDAWGNYATTAKINGVRKKLSGLVARRKKEVALFFSTQESALSHDYNLTADKFKKSSGGYNVDSNSVSVGSTSLSAGSYGTGALTNAEYSAANPTVITAAEDNVYSMLDNTKLDGGELTVKRTRIYKYSEPDYKALLIQDLSMNTDGTNSPVNEDGTHIGDANIDTSTNAANNVQGVYTAENSHNQAPSGNLPDNVNAKGLVAPVIRINDYLFTPQEIEYVEISNSAFIPSIQIDITTYNNRLMKMETPKEGDRISIFCNPGHGMLKSLRCDFVITNVLNQQMSQLDNKPYYKFKIFGELYIPDMYNNNNSFSFMGTSRDALIDAATKIHLGFFFSDPENTDDAQSWYCTGTTNSTAPSMRQYIQDVAAHSYKDENSFFDAWIDLRYGLTFVNINLLLGGNEPDELFDITFFKSVFGMNESVDNLHGMKSEEESKESPIPLIKILTNIHQDDESATNFYVTDYEIINLAFEITKQIGTTLSSTMNFSNPGLSDAEQDVPIQYSIIYNTSKYTPDEPGKGGFYIMVGPGEARTWQDSTYIPYTQSNAITMDAGVDLAVQSDNDAKTIVETGDNMGASGNVSKFYAVGYKHNLVNNMQLLKKRIKVILQGANFAMMRGERIPMIIMDNDKFSSLLGQNTAESDAGASLYDENHQLPQDVLLAKALNAAIYTEFTGWFIIQSISYIFDPYTRAGESTWKTELILTRREWPIPGHITIDIPAQGNTELVNNIQIDNNDNANKAEAEEDTGDTQEETANSDEMPLTGLKNYMQDLYNAIKAQAKTMQKTIKLVGARRYAIDKEGRAVDGCAYLKTASGQYLVKDAQSNLLYVTEDNRNNAHMYGEAMDIINGDGTSFDEVMDVITASPEALLIMYTNGLSGFREASNANGTTSSHWHIGTHTGKEGTWWDYVKSVYNSNTITVGSSTINLLNYSTYVKKTYAMTNNTNEITDSELTSIKQALNKK